MAEKNQPLTTQRAYTLRLRGFDNNDQAWRNALWATHEAVNKGAKAFGDWLLTLRGGLDHRLADEGPPEQRKDRRILLALSWLSVEDAHGAPDEYEVQQSGVTAALENILKARDLPLTELAEWIDDCGPSLRAQIRDDATWVNRSAAFESVARDCPTLTRDEIWDFLEPFFASPKAYLQPELTRDAESDTNKSAAKEDKAKDLVQKAGGWLSKRMGKGAGADFANMAKAYDQIAGWAKTATEGMNGEASMAELAGRLTEFTPASQDAEGVLSVISGPGHKSATQNQIKTIASRTSASREDLDKLLEWASADAIESAGKVGAKGQRPYSNKIMKQVEAACGFTYINHDGAARHREFSVMLDHAARRVNVAHSWIKNAETERRQFDGDSQRIGNVPPDALAWLQAYCLERNRSSGSEDGYRIRRRAIDGWEQIVQRWSRADCKTVEDRVAAARALQDDPEIDKFGDIQLFEALAAEDAQCVWNPGGQPSAQALKDFVFATDAMAKKLRFKVPAYRHPDSLRHPVFTDFGNSRWNIDFSAHRAPAALSELAEQVQKVSAAIAAAEERRNKTVPKEGKRESIENKIAGLRDLLADAQMRYEAMSDRSRAELRLWNGKSVQLLALRWGCKRLVDDVVLRSVNSKSDGAPINVSRADRLGRAAAGANSMSKVNILGLFDEKDWNGRLQAPRAQLDAIARHVDKHGWDAKAQTMVQRIRWLLSFSAKLHPIGPWTKFAERNGLRPDPQYWPHADLNKKRSGHGRLILSRLPSLRVLAVDLGHRFAAACAVWEAITAEQMHAACNAAGVAAPAPEAMYLHVKGMSKRGKATTTIYRRIGPDALPDGSPHPAPWARLDRQFVIKLQGEDQPPRKASSAEIEAATNFEDWSGRLRSNPDAPRDLAVDALMSETVRTARLAIGRHARRVRIACNLTATTRSLPGARQETLDDVKRRELLADTLADWHALATDDRWDDPQARDLWNRHIAAVEEGFQVQQPAAPTQNEERTRVERRKEEEVLRKRLEPLAAALNADVKLRQELSHAWKSRWLADDLKWMKKLRWLSRWLMPRGGKRQDASRRHVGGLSLMRVSTLTEFRRKVQVGFFTRMKPDGKRDEIGRRFGQATLDTIEKLKDNRVKQLASRIIEAALGIGREHRSAGGRDLRRPRECINDPRFASCHAVVIEDLSHYRPEETRTRRENRATMDWKSAEARKRLEDHCQLHGLHLRDVNPQYTSRQDSRTGAPGVRCVEIEVEKFLSAPMWRKQIAQAKRKLEENKGDARDRLLLDLFARHQNASGPVLKRRAFLPLKGGDLFVSADPNSPAAAGIQADLNAAANIGLRSLMDPDFAGRWWYVPCDPKTKAPKPEKVKGSILDGVGALADAPSVGDGEQKKRGKVTKGKPKEVVNLWRDPSARTIVSEATRTPWQETPHYWNNVQSRVVRVLSERHEDRPPASELPF